jgi:hypothetical protein
MAEIFPEPITRLPEADIPLRGLKAYLSLTYLMMQSIVDIPV